MAELQRPPFDMPVADAEIDLSRTKFIDPKTAIKLGKGLAAIGATLELLPVVGPLTAGVIAVSVALLALPRAARSARLSATWSSRRSSASASGSLA